MIQIQAFGAPFIEDLTDKRSPLNSHFTEKQKAVSRLSIDFFTKAKKEGHINSDINIPFLLFILDRTSEYFNHPELISIMPDTKERGYELAAFFLHAISNKEINKFSRDIHPAIFSSLNSGLRYPRIEGEKMKYRQLSFIIITLTILGILLSTHQKHLRIKSVHG